MMSGGELPSFCRNFETFISSQLKITCMKKILALLSVVALTLNSMDVNAQEDKSKRPSPPAKVSATLKSGAHVSIDYSQPSVKGRVIGKDLEPMEGKVWRTGANEATIFETDKAIKVEGKDLPAGKYSLFTIFEGKDVTLIFNKTWAQWGAYKYDESADQLRVKAKLKEAKPVAETLNFKIEDDGEVNLNWGDKRVEFEIK